MSKVSTNSTRFNLLSYSTLSSFFYSLFPHSTIIHIVLTRHNHQTHNFYLSRTNTSLYSFPVCFDGKIPLFIKISVLYCYFFYRLLIAFDHLFFVLCCCIFSHGLLISFEHLFCFYHKYFVKLLNFQCRKTLHKSRS